MNERFHVMGILDKDNSVKWLVRCEVVKGWLEEGMWLSLLCL